MTSADIWRGTRDAASGAAVVDGASGANGFNILDYGASQASADNIGALEAALADARAAGGGTIYVPVGRYRVGRTFSIVADNIRLQGENRTASILDFAGQTSGAGVSLGGNFDFSVERLSILNAAGHCLELNTANVGPHTYSAYGLIADVAVRGSRSGHGCALGNVFMARINGLRAQLNAQCGMEAAGYSTTLIIDSYHGLTNGADGLRVRNATYSSLRACGGDQNGGHAYAFEDVGAVSLLASGAEQNGKAAIGIGFNNTTSSLDPGISLSIDQFFALGNNTSASASEGSFLTLTSTDTSNPAAGMISIAGYEEHGTPPGPAVVSAGACRFNAPQARNRSPLTFAQAAGFAFMGDGAGDIPFAGPVYIGTTLTRIATLAAKINNGVQAFGGGLLIYFSQNNRSSGSRTAVYDLLVNKGSVGTSGVTLLGSQGETAGGNAASPSFEFFFDPSSNRLFAKAIGSTAAGSWYPHFTVRGNLNVVPG